MKLPVLVMFVIYDITCYYCFIASNLTNLVANRNENDESHQISNNTSHQKEPVVSQHNLNNQSEIISSDPPYLSQITNIEDEPNNISKPEEDNSTP